MKLKIAMCDDEPSTIERFKGILEKYLHEKEVDYEITFFDNAMDLRKSISENNYDVYFLDIFMPLVTEDDLAKEIRSIYNDAVIVYISSFDNQGDMIAEAKANAYLYKSMTEERMLKRLDFLFKECNFLTPPFIFKLYGKEEISVDIKDIKYIKSTRRELFVYLNNREPLKLNSKYSLNSFSKLSDFRRFIRISLSTLINSIAISEMSGGKAGSIKFPDGEEFNISREIYNKILGLRSECEENR